MSDRGRLRLVGGDERPAPHPDRQRQRSERSTNALLSAAADLLAEGGMPALTFAAIGQRAGYSRGMVTARFGNKDGLVDALVERLVATATHRSTMDAEGSSGLEAILGVLLGLMTSTAHDSTNLRALYALMFESLGDADLQDKFAMYHHQLRSELAVLMERGISDGSINTATRADDEAALIVATMRGMAYQWTIDRAGFDPSDALRHFHDVTAARLAADGADVRALLPATEEPQYWTPEPS